MGPKVGPSVAPLDLDPFFLKNNLTTLQEPISGLCLDLENDRYENSPPFSPSVFGQTPPLEEFVCLGGFALLESVGFPHPLAIFPAGADFSMGFLEDSKTRFLSEDSEIKVNDNL